MLYLGGFLFGGHGIRRQVVAALFTSEKFQIKVNVWRWHARWIQRQPERAEPLPLARLPLDAGRRLGALVAGSTPSWRWLRVVMVQVVVVVPRQLTRYPRGSTQVISGATVAVAGTGLRRRRDGTEVGPVQSPGTGPTAADRRLSLVATERVRLGGPTGATRRWRML